MRERERRRDGVHFSAFTDPVFGRIAFRDRDMNMISPGFHRDAAGTFVA
jgi:hypothetical protein